MAVKRRRKKRAARKATEKSKEAVAAESAKKSTPETAQQEWDPNNYLSGAWKEELRERLGTREWKVINAKLPY